MTNDITPARVNKLAKKLMKVLEEESSAMQMTTITLLLSWLIGTESDGPIEEVDAAMDNVAEAVKQYARTARGL